MAAVSQEKLEDVYELIGEHCTGDFIQGLLRRYKDDPGLSDAAKSAVKLSAPTVRRLATDNLRQAVAAGVIPESAVRALLREGEENDRQHIFLFKPSSAKSRERLRNAVGIGNAIGGPGWQTNGRFPTLQLQPSTSTWSDFRIIPNGWVAKLYRHRSYEQPVDAPAPVPTEEGQRWQLYETRHTRAVYVARYRDDVQLLELRVPSTNAQAEFDSFRNQLNFAVDVATLASRWDLKTVRQNILMRYDLNAEFYDWPHWMATDKDGYSLHGGPQLQDGSANGKASGAAATLVKAVAASNDLDKRRLNVTWKTNEAACVVGPIRTILGTTENTNEIVFVSQCPAKAVDYVISKLIQFQV